MTRNRTPINLNLFDSLEVTTRITEFRPEIKRSRRETSKALREVLESKGLAFNMVSETIGCDITGTSRMLKGEFSVPMTSILPLTDIYLNCTCSELLMGENWAIPATNKLKLLIDTFNELNVEQKAEAQKLLTDEAKLIRAGSSQSLNTGDLIYNRFMEMANDRGEQLTDLLDKREGAEIKTAFKTMIEQKSFTGRLTTLMYICCAFRLSPDFFLRQDYSGCNLGVKENGSDVVTPWKKQDKNLASLFLRVDIDKQNDILTRILAIKAN